MAQLPDYDDLYKLVLVGDSSVGKSKLLMRFTKDEFKQDSKATIGIEFAHKDVRIEGKRIRAQVWDTGGQERYRSISTVYYRSAVGALLIFDVTSRKSFQNLGRWLLDLRNSLGDTVKVLVVGNKADLMADRIVSQVELGAFAQANALRFIETSAKDGTHVEEAFLSIILEVFKTRGAHPDGSISDTVSLKSAVVPKTRPCCR